MLPQKKRDILVLQSSIERVINTTLELLNNLQNNKPITNELDEENLDINIEDWETLKETVVNIWWEERNRAYVREQDRK